MQVEILNSGKRRCHWSAEEKARIVAETLAASAKVAEVARKHGITPSRIFAWRREARAEEHGEPAAPGLVKVNVVASPTTAARQDVRAVLVEYEDRPAGSCEDGAGRDDELEGRLLIGQKTREPERCDSPDHGPGRDRDELVDSAQ